MKVARALERSNNSEVVAGAMSGDVFTENVQRAARQKRIERSS
ncbi:Hypothetical protein, putative [Bodo saltans]|uniref:Uncharacterized protein n=1 Tax=Bodo saltans TaxID=75058 RepID=A0A0S4J5N7_BODSA|nr:Hypothetical protein, putative [Bodo saltans]|eukprot:CUG61956.1 Hypothetical protein, putative [Bodo saltans]